MKEKEPSLGHGAWLAAGLLRFGPMLKERNSDGRAVGLGIEVLGSAIIFYFIYLFFVSLLMSCLLNIFLCTFCRDSEMSSSDRKSDEYPTHLYRQGGLLQGCTCRDQF